MIMCLSLARARDKNRAGLELGGDGVGMSCKNWGTANHYQRKGNDGSR